MDRYAELAASIIDEVENAIRKEHVTVVDDYACKCEGNTLLHGGCYHELELSIEAQIREQMTGDAHAVIHIARGTMCTCEIFLNPDAASERQAELFETIRDQGGWDVEEVVFDEEEFTLEMYNNMGDRLLTIEECQVIADEREV